MKCMGGRSEPTPGRCKMYFFYMLLCTDIHPYIPRQAILLVTSNNRAHERTMIMIWDTTYIRTVYWRVRTSIARAGGLLLPYVIAYQLFCSYILYNLPHKLVIFIIFLYQYYSLLKKTLA